MKKIVFSLFLSVIAINFVTAQVNPVVPLPADQAELFKYTSTPVSMYTGVLEAASLPINLQVTIDGNVKTYLYRADNAMKAAIRDFYTSTMYQSMTPADQQLFIQNNIANPGISQMLSNVNKIQSIPHQDVEDDANIRALRQAQSNGQSMPYTTKQQSINFNGQTIK